MTLIAWKLFKIKFPNKLQNEVTVVFIDVVFMLYF